MINTSEIKGQLHFRDGKTFLNLTLNNASKEYEVKSTFENNVFSIETDVDWALEQLEFYVDGYQRGKEIQVN